MDVCLQVELSQVGAVRVAAEAGVASIEAPCTAGVATPIGMLRDAMGMRQSTSPDFGANPLTLAGLSGMGDLVLTCTGDLSRNRNVGLQIGQGKSLKEILGSMQMVAEGVRTTKSARALSQKVGVEMPITDEVYAMLYEDKPALKAVVDLMTRPLRAERE